MHLLRPLAFWTFVALSAALLVHMLWPAERLERIVRVFGSPTPADQVGRSVENVIKGGEFVTDAPDGEAFAAIEFARPQGLGSIEHRYPGAVSPQYQIRRAALQWSDDASAWSEVGQEVAQGGRLRFASRDAGAHRFWRMVVTESGFDPLVVIGNFAMNTPTAESKTLWGAVWALWAVALLAFAAACGGAARRTKPSLASTRPS